jgi:uncharacterized protein (TIGR03083 family)
MASDLDYLASLTADSARFLHLLADADPALPVPSCPQWHVDDLLWHLSEVQWFWGSVVIDRLSQPEPAEESTPPRPDDRADLVRLFTEASSRLVQSLRDTPENEPVWTWSDDQSARFVRRRQAHEALIHRVDAELTVGARTDIDVTLAADGVDEALRVMFGGTPPWAAFTPGDGVVEVMATDAGRRWLIRPGRFTGTSPNSGKDYDEPTLDVLADDVSPGEASAAVHGAAGRLDLWLWGRAPVEGLDVSGDRATLDGLAAVVAAGVQ